MQPFDDSIPEELEPSQAMLVSMVRQASSSPVQLTGEEKAQLLERVQQRLHSSDPTGAASDEQAARSTGPIGVIDSTPSQKPATRPFAIRQGNRAVRFANVLAAVLLIAAITGL